LNILDVLESMSSDFSFKRPQTSGGGQRGDAFVKLASLSNTSNSLDRAVAKGKRMKNAYLHWQQY
jgi:hypothetical protein